VNVQVSGPSSGVPHALPNTLGLPARASQVIAIPDLATLAQHSPQIANAPRVILGAGSNVVLHAPIQATVLLNQLKGKSIAANGMLTAASGEDWHELVMWSLGEGYAGLENLALIPGTLGAAPVQNIGAYGVEIRDRLVAVTAWDFQTNCLKTFSNQDCQFGYRDSIFKHADIQGPWNAPRYFITEVQLQLQPMHEAKLHMDYADLRLALGRKLQGQDQQQNEAQITALDIAHAVISIRQQKLPNPKQLGNVGSFFKNPIVSAVQAKSLQLLHPDLPQYPAASDMFVAADDHLNAAPFGNTHCKLSAAWMIDRCGFKGARRGDVGVHAQHALVLVNYGAGTGREILALAQEIQQAVVAKFGVFLEPEPIFMPGEKPAYPQ
jgi:UDP-N-acetylmuramate dehydrogenase